MTTLLILAWLATGLVLGYHASRATIRANKAEQREALQADLIAAKDDHIEILETENENLGHSLDNTYANLTGTRVNLVKARRANDEHQRIIRVLGVSGHMLPTISGNYLDTVANLPVGWRLDMGAFDAETPIGLGVVSDHIAKVVPLRGLS